MATMNKWPVLGGMMILLGLGVLIIMASFIVTVLVTLLQLLAVFVGIFLLLGGIAIAIFGGRFGKRRREFWGPPPAQT